MKVLSFSIDNSPLLDIEGHAKRWHSRMGKYVDRMDVIVEMKEKSNIRQRYIADNVRILPVYAPHPALYSIIAYKRALDEHKRNKYDLITTEDPFRAGFAAWLFKRKTGAAVNIEYHNDTFFNIDWINERPVSHRVYILAGKMAVRMADSIRCVNRKHETELRKLCSKDREKPIEIIPVPTKFYDKEIHGGKAREIRRKICKKEDDVIILFAGRLVPVKKVNELIGVFAEIRKKYMNTHLLIVGDGKEKKPLMELAEKLGSGGIRFTGFVSEDEVFAYYGACDIFVNPAHIEPYGRVYGEVMSAFKPIVATTGNGAVEDKFCVHEKNSLIITPGNLDELRDSLIRLIKDRNLRGRLGKDGLTTVREKFDYDTSLKIVRDLWAKTVERSLITPVT